MSSAPVDISGAPILYFPINTSIQSEDVEIFGETITTSSRLVHLSVRIHANLLRSLLYYQENPQNRDDVSVSVTSDITVHSAFQQALANCLTNQVHLDMSYPWWTDGVDISTRDPGYQNPNSSLFHFTNFYELLLSQITYNIVGHPLAKASIANDSAILTHFRNQDLPYKLRTDLQAAGSSLKSIYRQLFRQKPTRFQVQDSTAGATETPSVTLPRSIPFDAGDILRFEVTLDSFHVKEWSGSSSMGASSFIAQSQLGGIQTSLYGANTYTLELEVYGNATTPWTEGTTYSVNNTVFHNGHSWRAATSTTLEPYSEFSNDTYIHRFEVLLGETPETSQPISLYHMDSTTGAMTGITGFTPAQSRYQIFIDPALVSSETMLHFLAYIPHINVTSVTVILNNSIFIPNVQLTNGLLHITQHTTLYSIEIRADRIFLIDIIHQAPPDTPTTPTPYVSDWILDTDISFRTSYG